MDLLVAIALSTSMLATPTETGYEKGYWDSRSVVYGTCNGRKQAERGRYVLDFEPKMTLTGNFDSAKESVIRPTVAVSDYGGNLSDPPAMRQPLLLVLEQTKEGWRVPSSIIAFMPGSSAMVLVDGPGDAKVDEAIRLIKKVRETEGQPARLGSP